MAAQRRFTFRFDAPAMHPCQLKRDRQPEPRPSKLPGARFIHPVKALKDMVEICFRDANPVIFNFHIDVIDDWADVNFNLAPGVGVADGVDNQVG